MKQKVISCYPLPVVDAILAQQSRSYNVLIWGDSVV